jgi:hypothetical protein
MSFCSPLYIFYQVPLPATIEFRSLKKLYLTMTRILIYLLSIQSLLHFGVAVSCSAKSPCKAREICVSNIQSGQELSASLPPGDVGTCVGSICTGPKSRGGLRPCPAGLKCVTNSQVNYRNGISGMEEGYCLFSETRCTGPPYDRTQELGWCNVTIGQCFEGHRPDRGPPNDGSAIPQSPTEKLCTAGFHCINGYRDGNLQRIGYCAPQDLNWEKLAYR